MEETLNKLLNEVLNKRNERREQLTPKEQIKETVKGLKNMIKVDHEVSGISTVLELINSDFKSLRLADSKYHKIYINEVINILEELRDKMEEDK